MCRLLLASRESWKKVNHDLKAKGGILSELNHLEKECGGHGNGYVLLKNGEVVSYEKGLKVSNVHIVRATNIYDWDYIIYHTRIKSCGNIHDANCHPFVDKNNVLAMNGTEHDFYEIANSINITDTEVVFRIIKDLKMDSKIKALQSCSSVFIGASYGIPFIHNAFGDLVKVKGEEFWASSFYADCGLDIQELKSGYTWRGDTKEEVIYKKPSTMYGFYGWNNSRWHEETEDDYREDSYEQGYQSGCVLAEIQWERQHISREEMFRELLSYDANESFNIGFENGYEEMLSYYHMEDKYNG